MTGSYEAADRGASLVAFAQACARGLAVLSEEDVAEGNLTLPLRLSAWIRQAHVDLSEACSAMLVLRDTLLSCSGLDAASEPVPLLAGPPKRAVVTLAIYLDGLVARAARRAGASRSDVVEDAILALGA